ncbi:HlyD family secretion protein [Pontibacter sp. BAB1700]|uniref:HlyD family efflux transporter periplasmic adaptor subunit n=1 Tax=Pontibacter sp. BAB1700 TaxID=1144253 RepID=UPI00031DF387
MTYINASVGQFVNPTDVLFRIADTDHLHVELTVFEKDVPTLKKGRKYCTPYPMRRRQGTRPPFT